MSQESHSRITEEYKVLHQVARILQNPCELKDMLQKTMRALTEFEEIKVENKAGIFLADRDKKVLRLLTTFGDFSEEFLDKEREVPFGNCLCGRVADSGDLLMSENCFSDSRHERTFKDMKAHGHYIVPLKSRDELVGVMFLYTNTYPAWYRHSQEVLLSIGGLIADAIQRKQTEDELDQYRHHLEALVKSRTDNLTQINQTLIDEIEGHKKTREDLLKSREHLRKLSQQIQSVREEEKSHFSREVHDEMGQSLTALKMDLLHLEKKCPRDLREFQQKIQSMVGGIDLTIQSVQRIAMELRPPILDAFGLCEAIVWQAGEYQKRYELKMDLSGLQEHVDLDKDLNTTLFRIFQESLTNIFRHAQASRVQVSMDLQDGVLVMKIRDNGRGIDERRIDDARSLGLIGIRERVRPWNGEVQFQGAPGKGTTVTVVIPMQKK
ncbi:MAG: ATP-binding protein [Nitrospinaceae bacterium]